MWGQGFNMFVLPESGPTAAFAAGAKSRCPELQGVSTESTTVSRDAFGRLTNCRLELKASDVLQLHSF